MHSKFCKIITKEGHVMIITGIIIVMLNIIIMGAVLFLDFALFSRLTAVSGTSYETTHREMPGEPKSTETIKAQKKSSLQTVA